jgi:hypothetical protein
MKSPASVFKYDPERASRADRVIRALCEARGLDEYWQLGFRLIATCEGAFEAKDALRPLVERLKRRECELLADLLIERLERRG